MALRRGNKHEWPQARRAANDGGPRRRRGRDADPSDGGSARRSGRARRRPADDIGSTGRRRDARRGRIRSRLRAQALKLAKFTEGLEKSRAAFLSDLGGIFDGGAAKSLDETLDALEDALLAADIGAATTDAVLGDVRAAAEASGECGEADVTAALRGRMAAALEKGGNAALAKAETGPTVILVLGANGMGKTTTIGAAAERKPCLFVSPLPRDSRGR